LPIGQIDEEIAVTEAGLERLALLWQILAIDRFNWIPESDFQ
jgi:hypothetical protein